MLTGGLLLPHMPPLCGLANNAWILVLTAFASDVEAFGSGDASGAELPLSNDQTPESIPKIKSSLASFSKTFNQLTGLFHFFQVRKRGQLRTSTGLY